LETTDQAIEWITQRAGFGSPTTFCDRFKQVAGTSPQACRRAFRDRV